MPEHGDSHSSSLAFPAGVGCFSKPSLCSGNTWNDLFMSSLSLVGILSGRAMQSTSRALALMGFPCFAPTQVFVQHG